MGQVLLDTAKLAPGGADVIKRAMERRDQQGMGREDLARTKSAPTHAWRPYSRV